MSVFPVIEFRQYRLHPGMRETLIGLFETEFIESQEECGMAVIGQFRDLDDPDRFTWLRGFASMESRPLALGRFYEGPVWTAHRDAANATMVDSDDVHLLRPAEDGAGFAVDPAQRPAADSTMETEPVFLALLCTLKPEAEGAFRETAARTVESVFAAFGGELAGFFVTLNVANNWPRLPVHEDRDVVAWFMRFPDQSAADAAIARFSGDASWQQLVAECLAGPGEFRQLVPTQRSALR